MTAQSMTPQSKSFRRFFLRGLGIILPTVLTIWLVVVVYNFVDQRIAQHINHGVRWLIAQASPLAIDDLESIWERSEIGGWPLLDLTGLLVAVLAIYIIGRIVGGILGRGAVAQGERLLLRVPIFKQVYPHVKQVTDLFFSEPGEKMKFSRVIAVQYPRKGIWSVGLVTGDTMRRIQEVAGEECITVFIPSSPTPFTGYTITVPRADTVDLPISIDEAFRFCVSGGVIVPESQAIRRADPKQLPNGKETHDDSNDAAPASAQAASGAANPTNP